MKKLIIRNTSQIVSVEAFDAIPENRFTWFPYKAKTLFCKERLEGWYAHFLGYTFYSDKELKKAGLVTITGLEGPKLIQSAKVVISYSDGSKQVKLQDNYHKAKSLAEYIASSNFNYHKEIEFLE